MTVWCWVRDLSTGHRYDVPLSRLEHLAQIGAVQEVPGQRRTSRQPRPPEHAALGSPRPTIEPAEEPADTEENAG